jgi:hypothetical protein
MFSERLENLIKAALQDGVLTDQEKASIVKRAQAEGEDIDEVEIYIQSLMQKRQQELNQKNKEANAEQAKKDLENEKERSKTLRKCPKCGTLIPNLTNVCPECGFFIEKASTDEKVIILKTMLKECLNDLKFNVRDRLFWNEVRKIIKEEEYNLFPNCYNIDTWKLENGECKKGFLPVIYNYEAIKEEASLYKENDEISSLLDGIPKAEVRAIFKEGMSPWRWGTTKPCLDTLRSGYADIASKEIASLEERIRQNEEEQKTVKWKSNEFSKGNWKLYAILICSIIILLALLSLVSG